MMLQKKTVSWFLSPTGRKFSFCVVTATGIGCSIARFAPNTYFLNKYKDLVHRYHNGHPVPVSDDLNRKFEQCLDILQIPEAKRKFIQPFNVFGLDLFRSGTMNSRFGCYVGIPINFTYRNVEDIDKENIQVNLKAVDWGQGMGKQLGESLILPDDVQMFALCREILSLDNYKLYLDSAYPLITVLFIYNLGQAVNKKLNLYEAPRMFRLSLYSILTLFGFGVYYFMKDFTEIHYETDVDKKLVELRPEFVQSGVQFYDKLLKRNQALRELMGSEGERKYTKLGNDVYVLRQPTVALTHRKQFFESFSNKADPKEENKQAVV